MNTLARIRKLKNAFYNLHQMMIEAEQKCLELEREKKETYLDDEFKDEFSQLKFDLKVLLDFISWVNEEWKEKD